MNDLQLVVAGDVDLEVSVLGDGEPVVIIQTALDADELLPLARLTASTGGYRVTYLHRRGYAGSGAAGLPSSMAAEVADCRAVMSALDAVPAHVVGVSYSAAVALSLASSHPAAVHTLSVMEPPPVQVPSTPEFVAVCTRLEDTWEEAGPIPALEEFMTFLVGPDWRQQSEDRVPGSVSAMERDASTFFGSDLPVMLSWRFDEEEAATVRCPVLYVGGSESGPWFAEVRTRMLRLLPQAEPHVVHDAGHLLASTHTGEAAELLVDFLRRHPLVG